MATLPHPQPQAQPAPSAATRLMARAYALNWEKAAYALIFALALFTRFYDLGAHAMSHDERSHSQASWDLYKSGWYEHDPVTHGPLLFHVTALSYFLFGDDDFTARIYPAVLGVAIVMMPLLFRKWIGRTAALLAAAMFLVSPYMVYYSRYIRHDIPAIFFTLLMVWAVFSYIEADTRPLRGRWLYFVAACMILMLASKEVAFIYIAIIGSFFLLFLVAQLIHRHWQTVDARLFFEALVVGLILGAATAMGLIVVLTIIPRDAWDQSAYVLRAVLWMLLVILAVSGLVVTVAVAQFYRRSLKGFPTGMVLAIVLFALVIATIGVVVEEASHVGHPAEEVEATPEIVLGVDATWDQIYDEHSTLIWVSVFIIVLAGGLIILTRLVGWWRPLLALPAFHVLIVVGTLVLPWLAPFAVKAQGYDPINYVNFWPILLTWMPFMAISIIVGLTWNWRWAVAAFIFYALFFFFFTTVFTNGRGLATGMVGSLGYWLKQQGVRRGDQPQYYYLLQLLFYEFLPLFGAIGAGVLGLSGFFGRFRQEAERRDRQAPGEAVALAEAVPAQAVYVDKPAAQMPLPLLMFFGYLTAANLFAYSLAGEKMPWLTTHITTPMIFLSAWFFARFIDNIDRERFVRGGWMLLVLVPLTFVSAVRVFAGLFDPAQRPFQGLTRAQLALTGQWLAALLVLSGVAAGIVALTRRRVTGRHLGRVIAVVVLIVLLLLTARFAWMAAFIDYDLATEYLVYAHSTPAVKDMMARIEELSLKTTDGLDLVVAYDDLVSWPYTWYLRNYTNVRFVGSSPSPQQLEGAQVVLAGALNLHKIEPLLQDRYYQYDVIRLWWPMQDYYHVDALGRVDMHAVDRLFSLNQAGADLRHGLLDVWWNRDYSAYARATGRDPSVFSISQWPKSNRMSMFVRRDIAAQVWNLGAGQTSGEFEVSFDDPYATNAVFLAAVDVLGAEAGLNAPRGMALDDAGNLYVADSGNHRVVVFDPGGKVRLTIGRRGEDEEETSSLPGYFNEPWGVAVADDGTIFVADTWNHRIQAFTSEGELITTWGHRGIDGDPDPEAFFGPRNVVVHGDELYVVDTGNKRIRVYDFDGTRATHVRDIGEGGGGPGQFEEPVGLSVDVDGNLIVADTWNRRIQVVGSDGKHRLNWGVSAWYRQARERLSGNLPFLVSDDRGNVYVVDSDTCRVIVFHKSGRYRYNFGRCAEPPIALTDLGSLSGLAIGDNYQLYVADPVGNRILRFDLAQEPLLDASLPDEGE